MKLDIEQRGRDIYVHHLGKCGCMFEYAYTRPNDVEVTIKEPDIEEARRHIEKLIASHDFNHNSLV